jgi:hypothetical protein
MKREILHIRMRLEGKDLTILRKEYVNTVEEENTERQKHKRRRSQHKEKGTEGKKDV